ncbi:MAG: peptidylprolyl isomerase [Candidatus Delongbacteria bacterium]|nr:peptidylprolyl isomerase [Candidatus Delongbacteria bacterium]MCG2760393.1 peptidylprolyl isomerase [Candidatus Delongbacteria bacterium]
MKKIASLILFIQIITFSECSKCDSLEFYISTAVFETDSGNIRFAFFEDVAPNHVKNFKENVSSGYYNGKTFNRIVPDFVIQGGKGSKTVEPFLNPEIGKIHFKGALASARTADEINPEMKSDKYEFYICLKSQPDLDGKYTVFGRTVEGFDSVKKISLSEKDSTYKPVKDIFIHQAYFETYFDSEKYWYYKNKLE